MPPRKASAKAAETKSAAAKKGTAPAKAASKATKAAVSKPVKSGPTTNLVKRPRPAKDSDTASVSSTSSKRKADEPSTESDIENEAPKAKKAKVSKQPNGTATAKPAPKAKAPVKAAAKTTAKKAAAGRPAAKKAATPAPEPTTAAKAKKTAEPASKKRKAEAAADEEEEDTNEVTKTPKILFPNLSSGPSNLSPEQGRSARELGKRLARRARLDLSVYNLAAQSGLKSSKARQKADTPDAGSPSSNTVANKSKAIEEPEAKKPATKAKPKAATGPKVAVGKKINDAPTQKLDIYVFGEGSAGELGLGSKRVNGKKPIDVKRPRLNDNLSASKVGVVQIACGGMHAIALTHDNKLLTWGVNDQGALGRDTEWNGGLRDADADSDSEDEDDDTGINPMESNPTEVPMEHFAPGTKFVQVVASDSATFVLTEDGRVYGWGTFRGSEGILGFSDKVKVQQRPLLIPSLKDVTSIATGSNHVLALDKKGNVVAWGCGQQSQLGRRIIERNKMASLVPQGLGLPRNSNIVKIACGPYHSFALDSDGRVWAWGLNNFAETGIEDGAGKDDAVVFRPAKVTNLGKYNIADIAGGVHHSIACTDSGELISWGRVDSHQVGIPLDHLNEDNAVYDEQKKPRILVKPTVLAGVTNTCLVAAGTDNNFAVTQDGQVYSWGFSANFQTGLGTTEDVETPTRIENTAIRDKKIIFADCGGQFSVLAGLPESE